MSRERIGFVGIDGWGWYVRTRRGPLRVMLRIKLFYDLTDD